MKSLFLSLALFAAVSTQAHAEAIIVDLNPILKNASLDNKAKAKRLFESVMLFHSIENATETQPLLEEVLKLDPELKAAQVMAAFTRPLMVLKGFYKRSEKLLGRYPKEIRNRMMVSNPDFLKFLNANTGAPAINNDEDLQKLLNDWQQQANNSRKILKANRNIETQFEQYITKNIELGQCHAIFKDGKIIAEDGQRCLKEMVTLNSANVASMLYITLATQAVTIFYNSYQSKGILALDRMTSARNFNATEEIQYSFLKSIPEFGLLKTTHQLKMLLSIGADAIPVMKYMSSVLPNLCQFGSVLETETFTITENGEERTSFGYRMSANFYGASLSLGYGCFAATTANLQGKDNGFLGILAFIDLLVSGKTGITLAGENDYRATIRPVAPVEKPVMDLKTLIPTEFNECGRASNLGEPTLGGIFPNSDGTKVLRLANRLDRSCY